MADKIVHSFQTRRQLNQTLDNLATTQSEGELTRAAREIVQSYPHDLILAALLKRLDTPSGQLRGGLGHVAALLPPEDVAPALHKVAADRQNTPQARVTAALILERFLGQELGPSVMDDLDSSNEVAFQSLSEAVEAARQNRHILLEYVTQMRQAAREVAYLVMDLMDRLAPIDRIELLRLIAQDDRPPVAEEARRRLEQLGLTPVGAAAARALFTIRYSVPPDQAEVVRRALRKLQFRGVVYSPPAPENWRALIGPADAASNQTLWFVHLVDGAPTGSLVGFVINGVAGIMQFFAAEGTPKAYLPSAEQIGELVSIGIGSGQPMMLLEIPFDFGRWLVLQTLDLHWRDKAVQPIPNEYKLYNDLLWQFADPVADEQLQRYYGWAAEAGDALAPDELAQMTSELLSHPVMIGWLAQNRGMLTILQNETHPDNQQIIDPESQELLVTQVLKRLRNWDEREQLLEALAASLQAQAAWLHLAGDQTKARNAHVLAAYTRRLPVTENPLLAALVAAGFQT